MCITFHLIEVCLCCFLDMPLYSNKVSTKAKVSLLIKSEFFPACFSRSIKISLSQSSLESDGKKIVSETPEAETIKLGDLSNFISVRSRIDLIP